MKAFKATGTFLMGKDTQKFTKEVAAKDKKEAEEQVYSIIGSKHGVKRTQVNIDKITPVKNEEIEDPVVQYKVKGA